MIFNGLYLFHTHQNMTCIKKQSKTCRHSNNILSSFYIDKAFSLETQLMGYYVLGIAYEFDRWAFGELDFYSNLHQSHQVAHKQWCIHDLFLKKEGHLIGFSICHFDVDTTIYRNTFHAWNTLLLRMKCLFHSRHHNKLAIQKLRQQFLNGHAEDLCVSLSKKLIFWQIVRSINVVKRWFNCFSIFNNDSCDVLNIIVKYLIDVALYFFR